MRTLLDALHGPTLLCDGAMGTQLQQAGLVPGACGEIWNLEHPEKVLAIHKDYVEAGSDCLITNTFGGCAITLARHGLADRVREINRAGVEIARRAFNGNPGWVLGDMGPFGGMMEPYGDVAESAVREAFHEQAMALVEAGIDAIIIETQTALEELAVALAAALEAGARCVIASMAFDVNQKGTDVRTMMGVRPEGAAEFMQAHGAHVVALNCGRGVDMNWAAAILRRYRSACDLPLMAQPNAGAPVLEGGCIVYRQSPEQMAAQAAGLLEAQPRIIGACCGSTPAHIRALRRVLSGRSSERAGV